MALFDVHSPQENWFNFYVLINLITYMILLISLFIIYVFIYLFNFLFHHLSDF